MADRKMYKLTIADPNLTAVQRELMEKENAQQFMKHRSKFGSRVGMYATGVIGSVIGIYAYTIYTMSRDDFMADIESEVQKRN